MSQDWRSDAACKDADTRIFFPSHGGECTSHEAMAARRLCDSCPVRNECLEYALAARPVVAGIWASTTGKERERIRRRRQRERRREQAS